VFHKLGFRYRKPRPLIAGTDPAVKKAFKKDMQEMANNPKIEVWVQDEVFFKLHGTTCKMWISPEDSDPSVLHNPGREHIKYYGAVRLRDGKFVYMKVEDTFNGDNFFTFLKYLRKITARSSKKTVLLLDRASYHRAKVLKFLPPGSPELSPIERVWKYTRRKCTHNRYFPTSEDLSVTVESQFDQWGHKSEALQRLCAIS
jgi:transposase